MPADILMFLINLAPCLPLPYHWQIWSIPTDYEYDGSTLGNIA